jgi:solute carrier family 8 (sodium/calcium exchanger)
LVKSIKKASPLAQTSSLEGFHSVLNHFAPKMLAYSYRGMYCRYFQNYNHFSTCIKQLLLLPLKWFWCPKISVTSDLSQPVKS